MDTCISAIKKQCIAALMKAITQDAIVNDQVLKIQPTSNNVVEMSNPSSKYSENDFEPLMAAEPFECYKWEGFDQSICDFFGGDKTILIGCYKGKKYKDWIHTHNIYTIRLGDTKGSMEANLPRLESLLELSVIKKKPVFVSLLREEKVSNYPYTAIRELLLNACMHRDLQSNTPLRFYEYANHLEILNAGGLYGNARPENFPRVNDYRNPLIASAMKTFGYVNMFNRGVGQVQTDLKKNGNPPADFDVNLITAFKVDVTANVGDNVGDVVKNVANTDLSQAVLSLSQVLSQVCPKMFFRHREDAIAIMRAVELEALPTAALMKLVNEKNRNRFKRNLLSHLIDAELVVPTLTDTPSSPKQSYSLTEKGKELLNNNEV